MRFRHSAATMAFGLSVMWAVAGHAQAPLIDAGQQAMIMHQGDLLEQQTAPNNDSRAVPKRSERAASKGCNLAQERERLRPEYERRVWAHGQQAANAWLWQEAAALGHRAGMRAKSGAPC